MRPLDHCVLPVSSLDVARTRLHSLGFTVAADAVHPFGTENCCVFFADGTYLEPLGIAQREDCERTARGGNQFTLRDQTFRFRNGDNGFSALAMGSNDADGDHKAFVKAGISAGRKLVFGRTMTDPAGNKARATFKLSFARDLRSPDCFAFTCQRMNVPKVDRSALQTHANGVTGIREIIASESNPTDFHYFLQDICDNRETQAHSLGMSVAYANGDIDVMTPEGLTMRFGVDRSHRERGLRFEGIVFGCKAFSQLRSMAPDIAWRECNGMMIADRADGQGAFFAFVEE